MKMSKIKINIIDEDDYDTIKRVDIKEQKKEKKLKQRKVYKNKKRKEKQMFYTFHIYLYIDINNKRYGYETR